MCIVVVKQENSEKFVISDYFGVKTNFSSKNVREDPNKLGYSTSFNSFDTFGTAFPKNWNISQVLLVFSQIQVSFHIIS